jgi:hypothetical protein
MEKFKLDLTKLTPVAEKDRVRGSWYVVADYMGDGNTCSIRRYHSGNKDMVQDGRDSNHYRHWFAIPPNLPGFPVQELPDEFELKAGEWEYESAIYRKFVDVARFSAHKGFMRFRRIKPKLPSLSIPEQTESERREWLIKELERLGK